jgi:hypothetical protein
MENQELVGGALEPFRLRGLTLYGTKKRRKEIVKKQAEIRVKVEL